MYFHKLTPYDPSAFSVQHPLQKVPYLVSITLPQRGLESLSTLKCHNHFPSRACLKSSSFLIYQLLYLGTYEASMSQYYLSKKKESVHILLSIEAHTWPSKFVLLNSMSFQVHNRIRVRFTVITKPSTSQNSTLFSLVEFSTLKSTLYPFRPYISKRYLTCSQMPLQLRKTQKERKR